MEPRANLTTSLTVIAFAAFSYSAANSQPTLSDGYDSPLACIEALHDGLLRFSSAADSSDSAQRFENLQPLIATTHDLRYIAEFTVRRHRDRFSDEERQAFIRRFERLSVMTYANRFVAADEDTFVIHESRQLASGRAQVITAITRAEGPDIPLEYTLHEHADGWRIINVIADGVSDLALKRAEYQRVLGDGSIADLMAELDAQIAAL